MKNFTTNESPLEKKMISQPRKFAGGILSMLRPIAWQRRRSNQFSFSALAIAIVLGISAVSTVAAQEAGDNANPEVVDVDEIQSIMTDEPAMEPQAPQPSGIDLLTLITRGGAFMIPIGIMSLLVVALAVERSLSLRRSKLLPEPLVDDLTALTQPIDRFNPSVAMRSCQESPSPLSRVVVAMLERTGQPLADIERAATDALEREADTQAAPIRWLTLAAAATPLMGLLGTVWGMIVAFHESTTLTADRSRSEQLSEGIYTALVTTLAGLVVAIPAAILALYLENRLAKLFHQMEEFAFRISPGLVRFAGRNRMDASGKLQPIDAGSSVPPPAAVPPVGSVPPPPPETVNSGGPNDGGARAN
ncbi:colicin uptake protein TolQ [Rubripirellula obstinata]|uniref:Colicin uptake protein TolQ n=1 Tax=Rubripirellula obstinata TaxID=406547 RepID=A0A5B1CJ53_9BACT|nr:MotA/TolQ/ExbB proton channel family protein [Rubripirellula obstinata]KAA1260291.1 colicin uptake protein TolQ [Rubripirellula obstinata]